MKKLLNNAKFRLTNDCAVIYLKSKQSGEYIPVFECHPACISVIKSAGNLIADGVVLIPVKEQSQ